MTAEVTYTFGQLMRMFVKLQRMLGEVYEVLSSEFRDRERKLLEKLGKESIRRADELERTYKGTIIEATLEVVRAPELGPLMGKVRAAIKEKTDIKALIEIEEELSKIYEQTSRKVNYISPDTAALLRRMSREAAEKAKGLVPYGSD